MRHNSSIILRVLRLALPAIAGVLLTAGPAGAVTTGYTGRNCIGQTNADQANFGLNGNTIKANKSVTVVCPVPKTTSGPGITLDNIQQVTVSVTGNVTCELQISTNFIPAGEISNLWYSDAEVAITNKITFGDSGLDGFWRATRTADDWLYAEIICSLPQGGQLSSYSVIEAGTNQLVSGKGYAILPPSYCRPDGANKQGWQIPYDSNFLEEDQIGTGRFAFDCPLPAHAGNFIQMTVGPPVNSDLMGCNINTDLSTTDSTWHAVATPEFPDKELPLYSASQLVCQMTGTDGSGDGKIVSYRTAFNTADLPFLNGN